MNEIHPSAVVEHGAELDGAIVGPYCVVKSGVVIGRGTRLLSHVIIEGDTQLGEDNTVYPFSTIGLAPQDLKYRGEPSRVRIGDRNQIRESTTIHRGTEGGIMETRIGNDCLLMAYSHVAHDCIIEDHVIMANCASLAGHVLVQAWAILGGLSGVHQFCKVGTRAFLSAGTMIALDVPPYCTAEGRRAGLVGINTEGLRRARFSDAQISAIKTAYREFYKPGRTQAEAIALLEGQTSPEVKRFVDFIKESERGVLRPRREQKNDEL